MTGFGLSGYEIAFFATVGIVAYGLGYYSLRQAINSMRLVMTALWVGAWVILSGISAFGLGMAIFGSI